MLPGGKCRVPNDPVTLSNVLQGYKELELALPLATVGIWKAMLITPTKSPNGMSDLKIDLILMASPLPAWINYRKKNTGTLESLCKINVLILSRKIWSMGIQGKTQFSVTYKYTYKVRSLSETTDSTLQTVTCSHAFHWYQNTLSYILWCRPAGFSIRTIVFILFGVLKYIENLVSLLMLTSQNHI